MAIKKGKGRYARYWMTIKTYPGEPFVLEVRTEDAAVIKKLISREKEKDAGWQLACQEFKNDLWQLRCEQVILDKERSQLTFFLKRRPLSI